MHGLGLHLDRSKMLWYALSGSEARAPPGADAGRARAAGGALTASVATSGADVGPTAARTAALPAALAAATSTLKGTAGLSRGRFPGAPSC